MRKEDIREQLQTERLGADGRARLWQRIVAAEQQAAAAPGAEPEKPSGAEAASKVNIAAATRSKSWWRRSAPYAAVFIIIVALGIWGVMQQQSGVRMSPLHSGENGLFSEDEAKAKVATPTTQASVASDEPTDAQGAEAASKVAAPAERPLPAFFSQEERRELAGLYAERPTVFGKLPADPAVDGPLPMGSYGLFDPELKIPVLLVDIGPYQCARVMPSLALSYLPFGHIRREDERTFVLTAEYLQLTLYWQRPDELVVKAVEALDGNDVNALITQLREAALNKTLKLAAGAERFKYRAMGDIMPPLIRLEDGLYTLSGEDCRELVKCGTLDAELNCDLDENIPTAVNSCNVRGFEGVQLFDKGRYLIKWAHSDRWSYLVKVAD